MSRSCRPDRRSPLESGRTLDARILPTFDDWDIRRYGSTQVALLLIPKPEEPANEDGDREALAAEDVRDE